MLSDVAFQCPSSMKLTRSYQASRATHWLVIQHTGKGETQWNIRICVDPSQTINKAIHRPVYTIPTIEEKLPLLKNTKVFTVVDVSEALRTIELDDESALLATFMGPVGRYCFTRMPFGISSGPEEYQRRQHEFLHGLPGVINNADDICISGSGDTIEDANGDHDRNLVRLLDKCSDNDLHLCEEVAI